MWIKQFNWAVQDNRKQFALLIDPDKATATSLDVSLSLAENSGVDFFLVGGSILINGNMGHTIDLIRERSEKPIVLFPGSPKQLSPKADALLLLSVLSGRNPDMLIGHHVKAAQQIKQSGLELMPTGYLLIDGGKTAAVNKVSNTSPIAFTDIDTAVATALAGQQLGMTSIYLEAGSGALNTVPLKMISKVKEDIHIPLWVGGGIKTAEQAFDIAAAGADVVVVGNILETYPERMTDMVNAVHSFNVKQQPI